MLSNPRAISSCYTQEFGSLSVCCLTEESHKRTCGYWYTVTSAASSHTAFATKEGLLLWLSERGLTLAGELPNQRGIAECLKVIGSYRRSMHRDIELFASIAPLLETVELDNAQYTFAKVTKDADNVRSVHFINCNYPRLVFDYVQTRATRN